MNSQKYWHDREDEATRHYIREEREYDKRIQKIYMDMLDACQKEIDAFYGKYAAAEKISIAEAKKRVSKLDIAAYERKAKKYVEDAARDRKANGDKTNFKGYYFSEKANAEMRLYNATMKINRLEMLKANIGLEMVKGHAELETFLESVLDKRTNDEIKRMAGILGETIIQNARAAHAIVNASFHNATFSDRLWNYHGTMKADMDKLLQTGLIQGKNGRVLAREMRQYYIGPEKLKNGKNGAIFNTERLMRTELTRVQTEAQKQSFIRNGFKQYTFIANSGCCDACSKINGKHFNVKDMMPGENAPPMHPFCRCGVAAYEDSDEYEAWLDYLEAGGTTADWNKFAKDEWKKAKKSLAKERENSIIKSRNVVGRNMSNGLRRSSKYLLNENDINEVLKAAEELGIPKEVLRFNQGGFTGFVDSEKIINIRGDVFPDETSVNTRDRLSMRAVLAHEYYGHYKQDPSSFDIGDWRDEFRASFRAAVDAPGLNREERRMLMVDAYDRAKEAGAVVNYNKVAKKVIYGYDD